MNFILFALFLFFSHESNFRKINSKDPSNSTSTIIVTLTTIHLNNTNFPNTTSTINSTLSGSTLFDIISLTSSLIVSGNIVPPNIMNYTSTITNISSDIVSTIGVLGTFNENQNFLNLTESLIPETSETELTQFSKETTLIFDQNDVKITDSSLNNILQIKDLIRDEKYRSLFDKDFINSIDDQTKLLNYLSTTRQDITANSVDNEASFFRQGDGKKFTKNNCYILRVKENSSADILQNLIAVFNSINGNIKRSYKYGIKGYSICFPEGILPLNLLKSIPWIYYVERDQMMSSNQIQKGAPWGLARISEPSNLNGNQFSFNLTGEGVNIYTIDSGIWIQHKEFGTRGHLAFSSFGSGLNFDCSGHGTEVASVAAGLTMGVAKKANIYVAQVLDCEGQGQNSDLVSALDWIIVNHRKPAVVNMSVGGPPSKSVDDAVRAVIGNGVSVVIAAGNAGIDACTQSPSRVDSAIVVAASNESNERASFSNFGTCVDIFAPGTNINSASIPKKSPNGYSHVSGTSLSAPFVAGVIALRLQQYPQSSPLELYSWLIKSAKSDVISPASLYSSPNLFLQLASSPSKQLIDFDSVPPPSSNVPSPSSPESKIPIGIIFIALGSAVGVFCFLGLLIWGFKSIKKRMISKRVNNDNNQTVPNSIASKPFL